MKKFAYIILSIAAGLAVLSGCDRKASFYEMTAVYFARPNINVYEDAGVVKIPVSVSNPNTDFMISYTVEDDTAIDGTDYKTSETSTGVLSFKNGQENAEIEIEIVDFPDELTGNKKFRIKIGNVSNEVTRGGFSTCTVTIVDNDHPLRDIFGEYNASGYDYFDDKMVDWTMTITETPDMPETLADYYKIYIDGIFDFVAGNWINSGLRHYVPATVSKDLSTITIPGGWQLGDTYQDNDVALAWVSISAAGGSFDLKTNVVFEQQELTDAVDRLKYVSTSGYGANLPSYGSGSAFLVIYTGVTIIKK